MTAVEFGVGVDRRAVPKGVIKDAQQIGEWAGGRAPVITQPEPGLWRLTVRSDRVEMVASYSKVTGRAKYNWWLGTTVRIDDGTPTAVSYIEDVMRAFADPDGTSTVKGMPQPTGVDLTDVPGMVRKCHQVLTDTLVAPLTAVAVTDAGVPVVRVGRIGRRWVITLDTDRITLHLRFYRDGGAESTTWLMGKVQVVLDGVDRSAEVDGDLGKALALAGGLPAATDDRTTRGVATTANSVVVRSTKVIRT